MMCCTNQTLEGLLEIPGEVKPVYDLDADLDMVSVSGVFTF